jgi:glucose-6-phosphate 1-dehydrogenase
MSDPSPVRSDALVFFGASGDLAFKQVFPALQALAKRGRLEVPVIAVGRKEGWGKDLVPRVKESLAANGVLDDEAFERLRARLTYVTVDFDVAASFSKIRDALGGAKHPLHYMALPPDLFERTAASLAQAKLAEGARLAVEKPFGKSAKTAEALAQSLHRFFPEDAIFRIDHFLGKEAVENIVYFRAANPIIESALSAERVESIQITMAETFGVEGRAKFYDAVGEIRDVVQSHLLEVLACLTMDLPRIRGEGGLRGARSALLAQVRTLKRRP